MKIDVHIIDGSVLSAQRHDNENGKMSHSIILLIKLKEGNITLIVAH